MGISMAGNRRHAGGMKSAMDNLRKVDERIAAAKSEVQYACGYCGKPIPGGCYCSSACAAAEDEESSANGVAKP